MNDVGVVGVGIVSVVIVVVEPWTLSSSRKKKKRSLSDDDDESTLRLMTRRMGATKLVAQEPQLVVCS